MRLRLSNPKAGPTRRRGLLQRLLHGLDRLAAATGRLPRDGASQAVGRRGEEAAYWYLRERGYTIVARNYRQASHTGEIDLIAWDGPVLVFVEVKTRTRKTEIPAELAVDADKRAALVRLARAYRRRHSRPDGPVRYRFDLVILYEDQPESARILLHRDAIYD